ncbi:hypothetical protein Ae201684P_015583 [Aphanomyces euteiches]|nr:hypothetical protein Ae201684P_015583 [Aphanomyces euteiches]
MAQGWTTIVGSDTHHVINGLHPRVKCSKRKQTHTSWHSDKSKSTLAKIPSATIDTYKKHQRKPGIHPSTPDKHAVASKRAWDGRVQAWRRHLHKYDPQPATPQPSSQEAAKKEDPVPVVVTPPQHVPSSSMGSAKGSIFDDFEEDTKPSAEIDEDDLL